MLRFLPILLLLLQALPMAAPAEATPQVTEMMSCCGGCCMCDITACQCCKDDNQTPSPTNTPFSITSIDFAPPLAPAKYDLPSVEPTGELLFAPVIFSVVSSNNCRQALLGRWQN